MSLFVSSLYRLALDSQPSMKNDFFYQSKEISVTLLWFDIYQDSDQQYEEKYTVSLLKKSINFLKNYEKYEQYYNPLHLVNFIFQDRIKAIFNRFPELKEKPQGEPLKDGFLEGLVSLISLSALIYIIPLLAIGLFLCGMPKLSKIFGFIGMNICLILPMIWALFVPGGLWYLLLPMLAPAWLLSFLVYRGSTANLTILSKNRSAD